MTLASSSLPWTEDHPSTGLDRKPPLTPGSPELWATGREGELSVASELRPQLEGPQGDRLAVGNSLPSCTCPAGTQRLV